MQIVLEDLDLCYIPQICDWRLNERHYGALIGMNKVESTQRWGEDQVAEYRRSYNVPIPVFDETNKHFHEVQQDMRYQNHPEALQIKGETLEDLINRMKPYWEEKIVPDIAQGKQTLILGHSNSVRALMKTI